MQVILTDHGPLPILDASDVPDVIAHPEENRETIFRTVTSCVEASNDSNPAAFVDILAGLLQLRLKCGQRKVILPDCVAVESQFCFWSAHGKGQLVLEYLPLNFSNAASTSATPSSPMTCT